MPFMPSIAQKKDRPRVSNENVTPYKLVRIYSFRLFKRCSEADAKDWILCPEQETAKYPITCLEHSVETLGSQPVILNADGSIWKDGTLFLLRHSLDDSEKDPETLLAMGRHLTDFMNTLAIEGRHYLDFSGYRFERPTYLYKEKFNLPVKRGEISVGTANLKIRSVIKFYEHLMQYRKFLPTNMPWKEKHSFVSYEDSLGYLRSKHITHTDLTFPMIKPNPTGRYIADGGRLIPLTKTEQIVLLESLIEIGNPEMLLIFIVALVTGMRIQTVLTLRTSTIAAGAADSFDLIPIRAGRGTPVDTKHDKPQTILMPSWLHYKLTIYIKSNRYRNRSSTFEKSSSEAQYIFLSQTGLPYYIAKRDRQKFESSEKGSFIRHFIKKNLKPVMATRGCNLNFSFHDLRATFGMNLVEERRELVNQGRMNLMQLVDYVRRRMNHSTSAITQGYLDFREDSKILYEANEQYHKYILDMCKDIY